MVEVGQRIHVPLNRVAHILSVGPEPIVALTQRSFEAGDAVQVGLLGRIYRFDFPGHWFSLSGQGLPCQRHTLALPLQARVCGLCE